MKYKNVNKCECQAIEDDWLEISYTQRNYLHDEENFAESYTQPKAKKSIKISKIGVTIGACILVVAILCGMIFISGNSTVFETARQAFIATTLKNNGTTVSAKGEYALPVNVATSKVDNGTVLLSGGKACCSLSKGTVDKVTATSVSVNVDNITLVYSNMTVIMVTEGQVISQYDVLGKYDTEVKVNIMLNGELINNVSITDNVLQWSV